jgi:aspartyl-tRNA(Asn)/glutamyl-tRNA(Gln) amidotransferase subunit C
MAVDAGTVRRIARLARIGMSEDELAPMAKELNAILQFVEALGAIDTDGVAPMTSVVEARLPERADQVSEGNDPEGILANAPLRIDGFFVVPTVVE